MRYFPVYQFWIPELKPYSTNQLLSGEYSATNTYAQPVLDYKQTRRVNGKIVSDLRKKVKARLEQEGGTEYQQAVGASETIEKYWAVKDKQYQEMKSSPDRGNSPITPTEK